MSSVITVTLSFNHLLLFFVSSIGALVGFLRCFARVAIDGKVLVQVGSSGRESALKNAAGVFYAILAVMLLLPAVFVKGSVAANGALGVYTLYFGLLALDRFRRARTDPESGGRAQTEDGVRPLKTPAWGRTFQGQTPGEEASDAEERSQGTENSLRDFSGPDTGGADSESDGPTIEVHGSDPDWDFSWKGPAGIEKRGFLDWMGLLGFLGFNLLCVWVAIRGL